MKSKSIKKLIGAGESITIEWKQSLSEINEIIETVTAFANTEGGRIMIGQNYLRLNTYRRIGLCFKRDEFIFGDRFIYKGFSLIEEGGMVLTALQRGDILFH